MKAGEIHLFWLGVVYRRCAGDLGEFRERKVFPLPALRTVSPSSLKNASIGALYHAARRRWRAGASTTNPPVPTLAARYRSRPPFRRGSRLPTPTGN